MRRRHLVIILILIALGVYRRKFHTSPDSPTATDSAIDRLLESTATWDTLSGANEIDLTNNADGLPTYAGGGEYANYSQTDLANALDENKRVIIIFEQQWDPTADALREDIISHTDRIPYNTILFFANIQTDKSLANSLQVSYSNSIIYLNDEWKEMRRSWNGVITLAQLVKGIDGLTN